MARIVKLKYYIEAFRLRSRINDPFYDGNDRINK